MNQTNARDISLSAIEARNLHSDIFALLAEIAQLSQAKSALEQDNSVINVEFNGGNFN